MSNPYRHFLMTTESEVRAAFWAAHSHMPAVQIRDYSGKGWMYRASVRCAFVEFVDALQRNGEISEKLASVVTL